MSSADPTDAFLLHLLKWFDRSSPDVPENLSSEVIGHLSRFGGGIRENATTRARISDGFEALVSEKPGRDEWLKVLRGSQ